MLSLPVKLLCFRNAVLGAVMGLFLSNLAPAFAAPIVPVPRPNYQPADRVPDTVLYKEIFSLQEKADWRKADRLIDKLDDDVLMGHILFQRYMHPTAYR